MITFKHDGNTLVLSVERKIEELKGLIKTLEEMDTHARKKEYYNSWFRYEAIKHEADIFKLDDYLKQFKANDLDVVYDCSIEELRFLGVK